MVHICLWPISRRTHIVYSDPGPSVRWLTPLRQVDRSAPDFDRSASRQAGAKDKRGMRHGAVHPPVLGHGCGEDLKGAYLVNMKFAELCVH